MEKSIKTLGEYTHTHTHTGSFNRGITLVSLIVTIIILIILAGISIASLTGNSLFEKAKLAKERQENAQIEEDEKLGDYENEIGKYVDSNREQIMIDKEEYNTLKSDIETLKNEIAKIKDTQSRYNGKGYSNLTIPAQANSKSGELVIDNITIEKDCVIIVSAFMQNNSHLSQQLSMQLLQIRDENEISQQWNGNTYTRAGALTLTRIFNCKQGDIIRFKAWNWNTSSATCPIANIFWYEL